MTNRFPRGSEAERYWRRWGAEHYAAKDGTRWITINPSGVEGDGRPVLIDAEGKIVGGSVPRQSHGKPIGEIGKHARKAPPAPNAPAPELRFHVTPHHASILKDGFQRGKTGGIGGIVAGQGVSVWKDEKQAQWFLGQVQQLEEVRTHVTPLKRAVELTPNLTLADTDRIARMQETTLGRKMTDRERAVLHVQAANAPYIPAISFFHDGPRRDWQIMDVHTSGKNKVTDDLEELHEHGSVRPADTERNKRLAAPLR